MQTLKIIRYTSRLIAAVSPPGSDTRQRFDALQSSIGTSRCGALWLGCGVAGPAGGPPPNICDLAQQQARSLSPQQTAPRQEVHRA